MLKQTFIRALVSLGIQEGDLLFVHSDLRPFGIPENTQTNQEILNFYYTALMEILGDKGTLAVPAYFYEYARYGEPFDLDHSPVSKPLGVFSSYVNTINGRVRSPSPMQSFAAVGPKAAELCGTSLCGYGISSPWHRLRVLGGKILFLGTTLQPMTYVHHIEQQYGVPHLYTKIYPYPVLKNGTPIEGKVISTVRYLDYEIEYQLLPFQEELKKRNLLDESLCGSASMLIVEAEAAFQTGLELLNKNPYYFLKKPPAFIPGKIPTDGITGKGVQK